MVVLIQANGYHIDYFPCFFLHCKYERYEYTVFQIIGILPNLYNLYHKFDKKYFRILVKNWQKIKF